MEWATHPTTFGLAILSTAIFGLLGILLIVFGYKLFDWITPINVQRELTENKNVAMAIVVAAVIIGVAMVISASISG